MTQSIFSRAFEFPGSEAEGWSGRYDEILQTIVRNGRIGVEILDLQREPQSLIERYVQDRPDPPLRIHARRVGIDDRVGFGIGGVREADRGGERPQRTRARESWRGERIRQSKIDREVVEGVRLIAGVRIGEGDPPLP